MQVVVGRVGRPQGVRGEVTVEVRTDEPERRFEPGAVLLTRLSDDLDVPGGPGSVVVERARWHGRRLLLSVEGVEDRDAAERLRGLLLVVEVDPDELPEDDDEYYDHQLIGLAVVTVGGDRVGEVGEVVHLPSQDLLSVRTTAGDVLLPFVAEIVVDVDLSARTVVVDPPAGLLDEGEA